MELGYLFIPCFELFEEQRFGYFLFTLNKLLVFDGLHDEVLVVKVCLFAKNMRGLLGERVINGVEGLLGLEVEGSLELFGYELLSETVFLFANRGNTGPKSGQIVEVFKQFCFGENIDLCFSHSFYCVFA